MDRNNTHKEHNFAAADHMDAWLRHPVLGDPSFDRFEKLGQTVHRSEPPYDWAVNGSVFCDHKTGWWYYYASLYARDYWQPDGTAPHLLIYRSKDKGLCWEQLGRVFPDLSCPFPGLEDVCMAAPDGMLIYDEETDRYWLTYDWGTGRLQPDGSIQQLEDHGVALAWAERPEGPFYKLTTWIHNNRLPSSRMGIFNRGYSSASFKRKKDWICLITMDSAPCYGWGLAYRTAKTPDGPWSEPRMILCPHRPEYYPELLEYCFCVSHEGKLYAPATSVAGNRNYQVVFAADLERAEDPAAWEMIREGSLWHARNLTDERYGIWGQTLQGFMTEDMLYSMYAVMDQRKCGLLSMASCPKDQIFGDGFTISGHAGKAISPMLAAYGDFSLRMEMETEGTAEVFLKYHGVLGPEGCTSNCVTAEETFVNSLSLEFNDEGRYRVLLRGRSLQVLHSGCCHGPICRVEVSWKGSHLALRINGEPGWEEDISAALAENGLDVDAFCMAPLAVCAHEVSILRCSGFSVSGEAVPYSLRYSAREGVLGAMHSAQWQPCADDRFITEKGYIGSEDQWVKWSFHGNGFRLYAPKGADLGRVEVWLDGSMQAIVDLHSDVPGKSRPVYELTEIPGPAMHSVVLRGHGGESFAVDILEVLGQPQIG